MASVYGRPAAVMVACLLLGGAAVPAAAEPEPEPVVVDAAVPVAAEIPSPDGRVESTPPATLTSPDGWVLKVSAQEEFQRPMAPLTTALSSREYEVGGTFNGAMSGPGESEPPHGTLEVGYQIGCGIDMSTSNGVSLAGTAGINSSLGILGTDFISPSPEGILPNVGGNLGGGITIGLKPGIVNIVPVSKKEFTGADPWVMVQGFRIKIDGCVGESFIRSYAFLTRSTDMSDAILAYYGTTKKV
ncbi:MAG: MspA family porin [Mycobacterium sp.]